MFKKKYLGDVPGGTMDKNPPANGGDTGSLVRMIPHAVEQPSLWATTTEPVLWGLRVKPLMPVLLEHMLRDKRSHSG